MAFLLRGALVEYSGEFLGPIPNLVIFQFNPEQLARTIKVPQPRARSPRQSAQPVESGRTGVPPTETFSLTAHFSAADDLGRGGALSVVPRAFGIGPQLAALEKMVYPRGPLTGVLGQAIDAVGDALGIGSRNAIPSETIPREAVPRILFIWGVTRVLPVKIETLSITEQKFDAFLNPVQAEVQLGLAINNLATTSPDKIGRGALKYSQVAKDAQALLNFQKQIELAVDIIPF